MKNQKTEKSLKQHNATSSNLFVVFLKTVSLFCDVALNSRKTEQFMASVQCIISGIVLYCTVLAISCSGSRNYENPSDSLNRVSSERKS